MAVSNRNADATSVGPRRGPRRWVRAEHGAKLRGDGRGHFRHCSRRGLAIRRQWRAARRDPTAMVAYRWAESRGALRDPRDPRSMDVHACRSTRDEPAAAAMMAAMVDAGPEPSDDARIEALVIRAADGD